MKFCITLYQFTNCVSIFLWTNNRTNYIFQLCQYFSHWFHFSFCSFLQIKLSSIQKFSSNLTHFCNVRTFNFIFEFVWTNSNKRHISLILNELPGKLPSISFLQNIINPNEQWYWWCRSKEDLASWQFWIIKRILQNFR